MQAKVGIAKKLCDLCRLACYRPAIVCDASIAPSRSAIPAGGE